MRRLPLAVLLALLAAAPAPAADDFNPYYPHRTYPKLITPQWVGEDGVECVVVLAIDDMRGHEKWETFLRPILERLKKIDGRAPVSIMTCDIDPKDEHLQKWLKEGLSLETHTVDHPCPLLKDGDFAKAKSTYDRCVDKLSEVPNSHPVAFRTPCCDSLNTVSPRFYAEIFNKTTAKGNFLTCDSSVFNLFTANDPDLPRELVMASDGTERFRKYLPADRTFVNYIEDYPYPYVIGGTCWEFPCVTPSDWSAQHHHKQNASPITLRDWKAALDATVIKKGVFCMVFHPYGWSSPEQLVDLIDHAVTKHGKKVKFLTFREAQERLNKNLLDGHPLRDPKTGAETGVRVEGSEQSSYVGILTPSKLGTQYRTWNPDAKEGQRWLTVTISPTAPPARDGGVRVKRDFPIQQEINLGGRPTYVCANEKEQAVVVWSAEQKKYQNAPFSLPPGARLGDGTSDFGLRFIDIDEDGYDDVVFSNEKEYGIYLFTDLEHGWSRKVMAGKAGDEGALPPIARNGKNNGFFAHSRSLWWQNESTNLLKDLVDRRSFNDLLMTVEPTGKSPQASLACLRPRPGFKAELVVTEPLVQSPIAMAWGPDGKLWVVEMGDYPLGVDGKGKPGGRVKVLESTKGDGRYDKVTVFLDGLPFPTGVLPWRKGAIVVCAPDVFYAEDTDGDGKADKKEVLYTGFVEGNQQHRINGPVWGLDGWLYLANGDSGGRVKSLKTGKVVDLRGRDVRIRPDTGDIDLTSGQTQYGRNRDDWGDWFGGNNSNPMYHFALADHYIRRNPHLPPPDPKVHVSVWPGVSPVYPLSRTMPRFNDPASANHFTSACSPIVYRDDLFGPAFNNSAFVSEPVHNLVHREIISPKGVTFTSHRAADEQTGEFLASSDNWFRPTMTRTGPDGALWVADMYRAVIEHPQWIPADWQKRLDLRAGSDMGRLYRVYPVDKTPRAIPNLAKLDTAGLVAALDSPNGWQRDMVQMMLVWKADKDAVPHLEKLAAECKNPLARLHALCTLDGMDALAPKVLLKGLSDQNPGVRRHAVRLCEGRFDKSPEIGPALVKLADDEDAQVRMQLACTLGEWDDPRAGAALGRLAATSSDDRYFTAAVMSSVNKTNLDAVLLAVLKGGPLTPNPSPPGGEGRRGEGAPHDRLGLARWLVSPDNPLVGRVTMNRQWAAFFGQGLVRTQQDFGYQGEMPSHPELLDWLAVELVRQGWSLKKMHRLIVLSATYRQSGRETPALVARDPDNRLLARGPRLRLEAELIRDSILRASGLLSEKVGGPSVFPPQPAGVTTEGTYGGLEWKVSTGADRYRRGLYTFSKRTAPFAMAATFDAPSGEFCTARRDVTNTPLQALTLLNDPVVVEATQALGRMLAARPGTTRERAEYLFRRCLTRPPAPDELTKLTEFIETQKRRFESKELDAGVVAGPGEGDVGERAAWAAVARVLFNLDEMIAK
jgi:putative membrane-bound dehydrogenase-like protein